MVKKLVNNKMRVDRRKNVTYHYQKVTNEGNTGKKKIENFLTR